MTFMDAIRVIKKGDIIRMRHDLDVGLDPNLANQFGSTLLMLAAIHGNTAIGRLLIEAGADLDRQTNLHDCALSFAVMFGHNGFVKLLLNSGVSLAPIKERCSLASFLEWCERYCVVTSEQMENIRFQFDEHNGAQWTRDLNP
jgi:ankyrin repeat protein